MALPAFASDALAASAGKYPTHPEVEVRVRQPRDDEPVLRADAATAPRTRARCSAAAYQWTGSDDRRTSAEMVNAMNAAISAQGRRHRGLRSSTRRRSTPPTEQALDGGHPGASPTTPTRSAAGNKRLAYIGQDLFHSGVEMGQRIAGLVGKGDVALFIATPGQLNIQPRIDGAHAAIKKSGKGDQGDAIATGRRPQRASWRRSTPTTSGTRTVKGMFAVDAGSTQGVGADHEEVRACRRRA